MAELYQVRKGNPEDQAPVIALVERAAGRLCAKMGSEEDQRRWVEHQSELFKERIEDPDSDLIVAESSWGIVGCVYIEHNSSLAREKGMDAYLGGLYSAAKGMGIGSSLNHEAIMCAAARGAGSLYARLPKSNKQAIRVLGDMGFRRISEEASSILPGNVWVGLEMQLLHGALEPGDTPLRARRS